VASSLKAKTVSAVKEQKYHWHAVVSGRINPQQLTAKSSGRANNIAAVFFRAMLRSALVFFLIAAGWARDPPVSVFPTDDDDPDSVHFWEERTEVPEESAEEWEAEVDTPDCEGSEVGSENHHFYFCYFCCRKPFFAKLAHRHE
jgi:hypothetical protein